MAVDEVEFRFGTIYANKNVPHEKIPVKKTSVMHTSHQEAKPSIDGKQLIPLQLSLDSKIEKTCTFYNAFCDKELPFQETKNPLLCGNERTHSGDTSLSQLEEILKFSDTWSSPPRSR
jgi:hypothetical protein